MKRIIMLLAAMVMAISFCLTTVVSASTSGEIGTITGGGSSNWGSASNGPPPGWTDENWGQSSSASESVDDDEDEQEYIIRAIAKTGGKIIHNDDRYWHDVKKVDSSEFTVKVYTGDDCIYIIEPSEGYEISKVSVDGEIVGAVEEYRFKNIEQNHTIKAYFSKISTSSSKPSYSAGDEEFNPNTGAL